MRLEASSTRTRPARRRPTLASPRDATAVRRHLILICALLVLGSGGCALVYQVAWMRLLRLVFGASTAASAVTLAIFMGGLGFGGLFLGSRADRIRNPLLLYGALELVIATSAALSPSLIVLARDLYIGAGGTLALGTLGGMALRIGLAALVLAVPALMMGGTLPAVVRAAADAGDRGRRALGLLYGANTIGAVVGTFWANFLALELLGTAAAIWSASALNAVIALVALALARNGVGEPSPDAGVKSGESCAASSRGKAQKGTAIGEALGEPMRLRTPGAARSFVYTAAGLVGAAFFGMELVWYRMLAPLLGGSVYTFGLVLAVALLGIGAGGLAYAVGPRQRRATLSAFALTCALEAILVVLPYALGDRVALLAVAVRPADTAEFIALIPGWLLIAALVALPPSLVAGYQFPLLVSVLGEGRDRVGQHVGRAYAANTGGAIAGALAAGLWLLPSLSAPGLWRAVVCVLAGLSVVAVFAARRAAPLSRSTATVLIAVGAVLLCGAQGPTAFWRHTPIGAGRMRIKGSDANATRAALHLRRAGVMWEADGVESSVALERINAYGLLINGKNDGNAISDAPTQVMLGLLPAILHSRPERALVIGLGTGETAGWLAQVDSIKGVDVLELEPAVVQAAAAYREVNFNALANRKVRIVLGDARELLLTLREKYDLILSEPSNPYRAGVASLFTREFYQAVAAHLNAGGIFAQWVQAYGLPRSALDSVFLTLTTAFRTVETWELAVGADLVLLARDEDPVHDVARTRARVEAEPYRSALALVWGVKGAEGLYTGLVASAGFAAPRGSATGRVNTDDRTLIEFESARGVGRATPWSIEDLRRESASHGQRLPALRNGTIDWVRVDELRDVRATAENRARLSSSTSDPQANHRLVARRAYAAGNLAEARREWFAQGEEPRAPGDERMVAELLADGADPRAPNAIEALRAWQPAEAEALLGLWAARRGGFAAAAAHMAAAFRGYRDHPWSNREVFERTLHHAWQLAEAQPEFAPGLFDSLSEPFAVRALDLSRLWARVWITQSRGLEARCAEALAPWEPYPLWKREFLEHRDRCYQGRGHPLAAQARRDLDEFMARQGARQ